MRLIYQIQIINLKINLIMNKSFNKIKMICIIKITLIIQQIFMNLKEKINLNKSTLKFQIKIKHQNKKQKILIEKKEIFKETCNNQKKLIKKI